MNTLRWIERARKHFIIFGVACVISNLGFLINNISSYHVGFGLGLYVMLLWAVNPLPLIYSLNGLNAYLAERKDTVNVSLIGKQWLILPIILFSSIALYCFSAMIMVALTGGA